RFETTSSTSRGCQPNRSARSCAVATSGATTLTQVRPLAESSWTSGAGRTTTSPAPRERERRMRGRLGIGTERVVHRADHDFVILARMPARGLVERRLAPLI